MFKTGNSLIDAFSLAVAFLPLLPVLIILLKRIYREEALNFLMLLCLINFIPGFTLQLLEVPDAGKAFIENIFSLLELLILVQIFKPVLPARSKEIVNILAIAFLSAMITFYLLRGISAQKIMPQGLQSGIIIAITLLALASIIKSDNMQVLRYPLFWIATGTLFYFSTLFLISFAHWCCIPQGRHAGRDKLVLLNVAALARYFFYILAAALYIDRGKEG